MNAQEVRTKLGEPLQKADDMDLYVISETETAQIAYDASHRVNVVSVDYLGGAGAPDYKLVVGPNVEVNANGAIYKLVRYESLGFWVSYNRSARRANRHDNDSEDFVDSLIGSAAAAKTLDRGRQTPRCPPGRPERH